VSEVLIADDAWSVQEAKAWVTTRATATVAAKQASKHTLDPHQSINAKPLLLQDTRCSVCLNATAHSRRPRPAFLPADYTLTCSNLPLKQSLSLTLPELSSRQELLEGKLGTLVMHADMAKVFRWIAEMQTSFRCKASQQAGPPTRGQHQQAFAWLLGKIVR
jgi:hypothetical protein